MSRLKLTRRGAIQAIGLAIGTAAARRSSARIWDRQKVPITGATEPALHPIDELMTGFLAENDIPGAAVAIALGTRLVCARGYGFGDVEAREPVRPESLFRIASLSKPFTALAVLRLVDRGKLSLEDKVFDVLKLADHVPDGAKLDRRWQRVTIRELLRHTGGWDRDQSFDPMERHVQFARQFGKTPPATPWMIIRGMLGQPLQFDPGSRHAYSNFGYCLLGRVIEAKTGASYEEHVRADILEPLHIRDMRIGRTRLEERAPGEVRYYSAPGPKVQSIFPQDSGRMVPPQYGFRSLRTIDAEGGWIASAADLARFLSAVAEEHPVRLLKPHTIRAMLERPPGAAGHDSKGQPKPIYYGLGWFITPVGRMEHLNVWHSGLAAGSSTIMVRRFDGVSFAILFNTRDTPPRKPPTGLIDSHFDKAIAQVRQWPRGNLFPELLPEKPARAAPTARS